MSFYFVDKISNLTETTITGSLRIEASSPYAIFGSPHNLGCVNSGIVSEAVGQLASWLHIYHGGFTTRPVFMFCPKISIEAMPEPPCTLTLRATIEKQDGPQMMFSGSAKVGERTCLQIDHCAGHGMPLSELEDPRICEKHFLSLTRGHAPMKDRSRFNEDRMLGEVTHLSPGQSITMHVGLSPELPFFQHHFPRFPVMPIVMINTLIGRLSERLFDMRLRPVAVEDLKIKSFLRPSDEFDIQLQAIGDHTLRATIVKQGKTILRGHYLFEEIA